MSHTRPADLPILYSLSLFLFLSLTTLSYVLFILKLPTYNQTQIPLKTQIVL